MLSTDVQPSSPSYIQSFGSYEQSLDDRPGCSKEQTGSGYTKKDNSDIAHVSKQSCPNKTLSKESSGSSTGTKTRHTDGSKGVLGQNLGELLS